MTTKQRIEIDNFISRLTLMAEEAMRLGLLRTSHALRQGEQSPVSVAGYELADILDWDSDDPINGPYDGESERCPCCHGSGLAKDCTFW